MEKMRLSCSIKLFKYCTGGSLLVDRSKVIRGRGACNLLRFDVIIAQMKAEILKFTSLIQLFIPIQILSEMWIDEVR